MLIDFYRKVQVLQSCSMQEAKKMQVGLVIVTICLQGKFAYRLFFKVVTTYQNHLPQIRDGKNWVCGVCECNYCTSLHLRFRGGMGFLGQICSACTTSYTIPLLLGVWLRTSFELFKIPNAKNISSFSTSLKSFPGTLISVNRGKCLAK